jgi:hypothetical protein
MKRIVGSLISVVAGWAAATIVLLVVCLFLGYGTNPGTLFFPVVMATFIAPAWLFVFLPLYAFVPLACWIARWGVAALLGTLCGPLILVTLVGEAATYWPFAGLAAVVGAVSAAVGALTLGWSRRAGKRVPSIGGPAEER